MKRFTTTTSSDYSSAFDTTVANKILKDIKNGLTYNDILKKYPKYNNLVDFYWERNN